MKTFHHWQIRGKLIACFGITLGLVLMVLGTVIYLTFADAVRGSQARLAVLNATLARTVVDEHAADIAQALHTGQPLSAALRLRLGGLGLPVSSSLTVVNPSGQALVLQGGDADLRSVMAQLQPQGTQATQVNPPSPRPAKLSAAQDFEDVAHLGSLFVRAEPLSQPGWTLYFAVPEATFLADVVALKNRIIAATVVVLWVSVWIVLIIAHRLTLPVKTLSAVMAAPDPTHSDTPPTLLDRGDEIGELARSFEAMRGRLRALINVDALTQIYNRRFITAELKQRLATAQQTQRPLACLILDVDFFKSVNDTFGHSVGDQALVHCAAVLQNHSRPGDLLARYGGEEFLVLLPDTDLHTAQACAEHLRQQLERTPLRLDEEGRSSLPLTVSIGLSALNPAVPGMDAAQAHNAKAVADRLVEEADQALYEAKRQGRNRVMWRPSADAAFTAVQTPERQAQAASAAVVTTTIATTSSATPATADQRSSGRGQVDMPMML